MKNLWVRNDKLLFKVPCSNLESQDEDRVACFMFDSPQHGGSDDS